MNPNESGIDIIKNTETNEASVGLQMNLFVIFWGILSILVPVHHFFVANRSDVNIFLFILPCLGLITAFFSMRFLSSSKYYNNYAQTGENILYSLLLIAIVINTGVLDSPFITAFLILPFCIKTVGFFSPISTIPITLVLILLGVLIFGDTQINLPNIIKFSIFAFSFGVIGILVNIFYKKDLYYKEEIRSQEHLYSNYFNTITQEKTAFVESLNFVKDGVIITNPQEGILFANQQALTILHTSLTSIKNRSINELFGASAQQNPENQHFTLSLRKLEGELVKADVTISTIRDDKGNPQGKVYVIKDITEETEFEAMKLDFVAIAAHQLRTPLTTLKGYLSILWGELQPKNILNQEESTFLQKSLISADQLASLIENLLNVSRVEKGQLKLQLRPVAIDEIIKSCFTNLQDHAKQKQVNLALEKLNPPYPLVLGDPNLLKEAICNLISNAVAYNNPNGWVNISMQKSPGLVTIHISDNGRGISQQDLPLLFTKFFRATKSLTQISNGMGLGLYITKSIVDAHHGKIWVNSIFGKGTTFSISLPAALDSPQSKP